MKVQYLPSFIRDLKRLKSSSKYKQIKELVFTEIQGFEQLESIPGVKKLKGEDFAYRIRLGDYRIGFYVQDNTVIFARVVHRREFYRYFP